MAAVAGAVIAMGPTPEAVVVNSAPGVLASVHENVILQYGYRMRAYDETLGEIVYWTAIYIDSTGTEYAGPGPLVKIIVSHVIGT